MRNIIKDELSRRYMDNDTLFAIVGPEIKLRRTSLNKTLKFIAFHICSISYVSKIESNAIKPNRMFLNEIGKKVNMNNEQIDGLFDLRAILNQGIKDFLFNKSDSVKKALKEKSEYVNYRYKLLILLDSINDNNLSTARDCYNEIIKISKSMSNYDFKIFSLLSSIYLYKCGNVKEAYDNLSELSTLELSNHVRYITDLYMFYCLNSLCRPETSTYYRKIRENLIYIGSYELLDEINYNYALYYIRSGSPDFSLTLIDTIRDVKRKRTIELISAYMCNMPINHFKRKELLSPAKCIYDYLHDKKNLEEDIKEGISNYYKIDFNPLIFNYFLLEDHIQKYNYLTETVAKELARCDDLFAKKFFIKEAFRLCEKTAKYKSLFDIYKIYYKEEYI